MSFASEYPTDAALIERYAGIEQSAQEAIRAGQVIGNPIFGQRRRGNQWAISTYGLIHPSSAGDVFDSSRSKLQGLKVINWVPSEFLHITLTELAYNERGYRAAGLSVDDFLNYRKALSNHFPADFDPIRLRLHRIIPTLDPKDPKTLGSCRTAALVGAFLTDGSDTIFKVKEALVDAVRREGLLLSARLGGPSRVLFVTLGRFDQGLEFDQIGSFLSELDEVNNALSEFIHTEIGSIEVVSTSELDYASPRGHLGLWPPVALDRLNQIQGDIRLLRPQQRRRYLRTRAMLEG